jgi:hypothetical protein
MIIYSNLERLELVRDLQRYNFKVMSKQEYLVSCCNSIDELYDEYLENLSYDLEDEIREEQRRANRPDDYYEEAWARYTRDLEDWKAEHHEDDEFQLTYDDYLD